MKRLNYDYVKTMKDSKNIKDEFIPLLDNLSIMANDIKHQMMKRQKVEQELIEAGDELEEKVIERTKELTQTQIKLIETSRKAGMAEIATNVLHNVGNALNSINVSTDFLQSEFKKLKIPVIHKVVALLSENKDNLNDFISNDPKGKMLPSVLLQFSEYLSEKKELFLDETKDLKKDILHIQNIISTQQDYAKNVKVEELQSPIDIVNDAIRMNENAFIRHNVHLIKEFEKVPEIKIDKHKVLQILVNIISNAKYAFDKQEVEGREVLIKIRKEDNFLIYEVIDNGIGIEKENLEKIFNYGFTTRKEGHGFGLHNSSNNATELNGKLIARSEGIGKGATFTLKIPY